MPVNVGGPAALLEHFLEGKPPNTKDAYRRDIKAFAKHLNTTPDGVVWLLMRCTRGQANGFALTWLKTMIEASLVSPTHDPSVATRARRISTLRSLTKALQDVDAISWSLRTKGEKVENYRDTRGPREETIHAMFAQCGEDRLGLRNRVIIGLLVLCLLRRSEVIGLRVKHLDLAGARLLVHGKGSKVDWIPMPTKLIAAVRHWFDEAGINDPEAPVVHSLSQDPDEVGKPLTKDGLDYIVSKLGEKVGEHVWPHGLRHAGITLMLDKGHDPRSVQRVSRHRDIRTLFRYDDNRRNLGGKPVEDLGEVFLGEPVRP